MHYVTNDKCVCICNIHTVYLLFTSPWHRIEHGQTKCPLKLCSLSTAVNL